MSCNCRLAPPFTNLRDVVPEGFTFQNYIDGSPPVNGRFMALYAANGDGKRVTLPCKVIDFDKATKTAVVKASDGVEITLIDIPVPIKDMCIEVWGVPITGTTLSTLEIKPLPDDHDFDIAEWKITYLLKPSNWDEAPPVGELDTDKSS